MQPPTNWELGNLIFWNASTHYLITATKAHFIGSNFHNLLKQNLLKQLIVA